MKKLRVLSDSPKTTQKVAKILIKTLLNGKFKPPHIFTLSGNLGAGKTTFVQGLAKALKIKNKILSPTFLIIKEFKIPKKTPFEKFYHIDCYRLENPEELLSLGFKEMIANPKNLIFIEWPEKIKKILPKKTVWLKFKVIDENKRLITQ